MWHSIIHFLTANPSIAIFLCLGLGYFLGKVHYKSFAVGSTVGVLIIGLLVGQIAKFSIPAVLKNIFFDLFIFTIGYEVGPAFVRSFKKNGVRLVIDGCFFAVVAFLFALIVFKIFHVGQGEGAGILAGALTQSAVIGTSASSISTLHISHAAKLLMNSQVAIAYAITYVFGTVGVVIFIKNIAPKILGVDLKEETKKVVEQLHYHAASSEDAYPTNPVDVRAYQIHAGSPVVNWSISHFERHFHDKLVVERMFVNATTPTPIAFTGKTKITPSTVITVVGRSDDFVSAADLGATEMEEDRFRNIQMVKRTVKLTRVYSPAILPALAAKGLVITAAKNQTDSSIDDFGKLHAGDSITLFGPAKVIEHFIPSLGYDCSTGTQTDVSFLSIGIVVGILIGSIVLTIKAIPLTLGAGGGALFAGLFFGWWQDQHPRNGNIPASVRWLLKSLGLNLFIGCVGLSAGAAFVPALKQMGWGVLIIGAFVSIVPFLITLLFGKYVLHLNAVDNIGSLCGSGTITAALNAVTEEEGSSVFALAYTPTYAIGNILLTIMGPLAIALL